MTKPYNVLVFPCGSEIGLEIHRSLKYSTHINLYGGNSVSDHGKFVYENYIEGFPFYNHPDFIPFLKKVIKEHQINAIYPAMDSVIVELKKNEAELGCKIISSELETAEICLSKKRTYNVLKDVIETPALYDDITQINKYPVFLKPDVGYGSRGAKIAHTIDEVIKQREVYENILVLEYLPGKEYTIDCFTDFKGNLLYTGPRERSRISNGISVNTATMLPDRRFELMAQNIHSKIKFNGAWFFQVKEREDETLVLMEIASRFGGSSSVYRIKGVNFAALSLFNAFEVPVEIIENDYQVTMDRALNNKYKINIEYDTVYVDFDDTLIVNGLVNTELVAFLYQCFNKGKKLYLITKHKFDIHQSLKKYRIAELFDKVIHIERLDSKHLYCEEKNSIFIDDSFMERKEIKQNLNISVFNTDQIEAL